jgi:hypothetical protein
MVQGSRRKKNRHLPGGSSKRNQRQPSVETVARRDRWIFLSRAYWPELVVVLQVVVFFVPLLWGGKILFAADLMYHWRPWNDTYPQIRDAIGVYNPVISDPVNIGYPAYLDLARNRASVMLLWDSSSYGGTPVQTIFWYPPLVLLFFIGVPPVIAPTLSMIVHALIAGLGFVRLSRALGLAAPGAALAATIYTWNSWMTTWLEYETIQRTLAWLPVAAILLLHCIRGTSKWACPLASLAIALIVTSGNLQFALYGLLLLALFGLTVSLQRVEMKRSLAVVVGVFLVALGLTTIFYVQQYYVLSASTRGETYTPTSLPPSQIATLVSPEAFGNPVLNTSWSRINYSEGTFYLASAGLVLPFVGLLAVRRLWRSLSGVALLLLGGTAVSAPVFDLLEAAPVIGSLAVSRHIAMAIPILALLAGVGADHLWRADAGRRVVLAVAAALTCATILVAVVLWSRSYEEWLDLVVSYRRRTVLAEYLVPNGLYLGGLVGTATLTIVAARTRRIVFIVLLVALAFAELAAVGWVYNTRVVPSAAYPPLPELETLRSSGGKFRIMGITPEEGGTVYPPNMLRAYDFETVNGFGSFVPARIANYVRVLEGRGPEFMPFLSVTIKNLDSRLLDAMNVTYVVKDAREVEIPRHFKAVEAGGAVQVFRNTRSTPRAYFVRRVTASADEGATLARLGASSWRPEEEAVVEGWPVDREFTSGTAAITRYGPHELWIDTRNSGQGFLVIADGYDEGWRAYIDGRPAPLYRTNSIFRGILVPAGEHSIRLAYSPSYLAASAALSALLLMAGAAFLVGSRFYHFPATAE